MKVKEYDDGTLVLNGNILEGSKKAYREDRIVEAFALLHAFIEWEMVNLYQTHHIIKQRGYLLEIINKKKSYYFQARAREYDGHTLGSGDSLTIEGVAFTWDKENSRWQAEVTQSEDIAVTYDTFTSGNEATYSVTAGNMNGQSVTVTWGDPQPTPGGPSGGSVTVPTYPPDYVPDVVPEVVTVPTQPPKPAPEWQFPQISLEPNAQALGGLIIVGLIGGSLFYRETRSKSLSSLFSEKQRRSRSKKVKWQTKKGKKVRWEEKGSPVK